jgi:hypothetical protein
MKYFSTILCLIAIFVTINSYRMSKGLMESTDSLVKAANERADHAFKIGYRMGAQMMGGRVTSESFIRDAGKEPNIVKLKNIVPDKCDVLFRFKDGVQACISKPVVGDKNEHGKGRPDGKEEDTK